MLKKMIKQQANETNTQYRRRIRRIRSIIHEAIAGTITMILMGMFIAYVMFAWLTEDTGYYRYNDGTADGTGVYYEWVMANEED